VNIRGHPRMFKSAHEMQRNPEENRHSWALSANGRLKFRLSWALIVQSFIPTLAYLHIHHSVKQYCASTNLTEAVRRFHFASCSPTRTVCTALTEQNKPSFVLSRPVPSRPVLSTSLPLLLPLRRSLFTPGRIRIHPCRGRRKHTNNGFLHRKRRQQQQRRQ